MRILVISNYFPPYELGGYEQLCRDVCVRLRARGHAVLALTSRRGVGKREGGESADSNTLRRLHLQIEPGLTPLLQFLFARPRRERHNAAVLHEQVTRFRPDVIFCWNLENLGPGLALAAERFPGVGVAHWLAGRSPKEPDVYEEYWTTPGHRPWMTWVKRLARPWALHKLAAGDPRPQLRLEHVAVVSHFLRDQAVQRGFLPPAAQVIHNGVELDEFAAPVRHRAPGAPWRLLQAGRLDPQKGAYTTLQALALLLQNDRLDVRLTLAGDGPPAYRQLLNSLVEQHELENYVQFTGWLPRAAMPALLAEHDTLILATTENEPLARIMLEAMASGLVVVGTLTGGTGEALRHEETGLTFAPHDAAGLARQVARLIDDPALYNRLAGAGRAAVRAEYGLEYMVDQCEALLRRARQAARGSQPVGN